MFHTAAEQLLHFKEMEVRTRRKVGGDVRHPEACPMMHIQGVAWGIPPKGSSLRPSFAGGEVSYTETGGIEWPEIDAFLKLADVEEADPCPTCGKPRKADMLVGNNADFLVCAWQLAAKVLRVQYDLTDEDLADLFAMDEDEPDSMAWLSQLFHWSMGWPVNPDPASVEDFADFVNAQQAELAQQPEATE